MTRFRSTAALLLAGSLTSAAGAAELELMSRVDYPAGATQPGIAAANTDAALQERRSFSEDGRYFVFESAGTALVAGVLDLNGGTDVFLFDRETRTTRLISHAAGLPLVAGRGVSTTPRITADGRYVFFRSTSSDLAASPSSGGQIFRHDRAAGTTRLVSHQAGAPGLPGSGDCRLSDISSDGRYAVFHSFAPSSQLVPGTTDTNAYEDLFQWDASSDAFALLTRKVDAPNETPGLGAGFVNAFVAGDGATAFRGPRRVAIPADGGPFQAYLYDPSNGAISLVSRSSNNPAAAASSASTLCDFSADGRYLLFMSPAGDLTGASQQNVADDLFLFDRQTGTVELISERAGQPGYTGNGQSYCGQLSDDGRYVYFPTLASDLVAGITDLDGWDMVRRDRQTGATILVSRTAASPSVAAGGVTIPANELPGPFWMMTPDGSRLLFASEAQSLAAPGSLSGFPRWSFAWDNLASSVTPAAPAPDGSVPASIPQAISPGGDAAVFATAYPELLAGVPHRGVDNPAQLVLREAGGNTLLAAAAFAGRGSAGLWHNPPYVNEQQYPQAQVSPDGSRVAFITLSNEICGDSRPLCLVDRKTGQAFDVRHRWDDPEAPVYGPSFPLQLSQDGGKLLLASASEGYAPNDVNGETDLFLYDVAARSYELISHAAGTPGTTGSRGLGDVRAYKSEPMMTADASRIVFASRATNYVVPGGAAGGDDSQIFLADRNAGNLRLISHRAGSPALPASDHSLEPQISADGKFALFYSFAVDLVPGFVDANNTYNPDIYLYDLQNGSAALVSHVAGAPARAAVHSHRPAYLSADGRYVAHGNDEMFMMVGATDGNATYDVFRYDRATGENTLVSHAAGNPLLASNGSCVPEGMSQNGRFVLMRCDGSDLLPGVAGVQLYLWDGDDGSVRLVSHRLGSPSVAVGDQFTTGRLAADGGKVYFSTASPGVIPGLIDRPGTIDVFVWERSGGRVSLLTSRFGASNEAGDGECIFESQGAPLHDALLLSCTSPSLVPYDNNLGYDFFLASTSPALFADGFESGSTSAWSQ